MAELDFLLSQIAAGSRHIFWFIVSLNVGNITKTNIKFIQLVYDLKAFYSGPAKL